MGDMLAILGAFLMSVIRSCLSGLAAKWLMALLAKLGLGGRDSAAVRQFRDIMLAWEKLGRRFHNGADAISVGRGIKKFRQILVSKCREFSIESLDELMTTVNAEYKAILRLKRKNPEIAQNQRALGKVIHLMLVHYGAVALDKHFLLRGHRVGFGTSFLTASEILHDSKHAGSCFSGPIDILAAENTPGSLGWRVPTPMAEFLSLRSTLFRRSHVIFRQIISGKPCLCSDDIVSALKRIMIEVVGLSEASGHEVAANAVRSARQYMGGYVRFPVEKFGASNRQLDREMIVRASILLMFHAYLSEGRSALANEVFVVRLDGDDDLPRAA